MEEQEKKKLGIEDMKKDRWIVKVSPEMATPSLKDNRGVELNVNQEFMNLFSAAKFIPHTNKSLFPSVREWSST